MKHPHRLTPVALYAGVSSDRWGMDLTATYPSAGRFSAFRRLVKYSAKARRPAGVAHACPRRLPERLRIAH